MIHILMKIMWAVFRTIQLPVLVLTVIVVPRQMMKDFHHKQKSKKLWECAVVHPDLVRWTFVGSGTNFWP